MGAGASIDTAIPISKDKVKELAGENWNEELEKRYTIAADKSDEALKLDQLKFLAPQLFPEATVTLDDAKQLVTHTGREWNDEMTELFNGNAEEGKINLPKWATLAPMLFETEEDRKVRLEQEYQAMLAKRAEGEITCNYFMDDLQFPISGNSLTAARIDEDFGLTDVMPGCRIRLSTIDSKARTSYENAHVGQVAPFVREDPEGTFRDLLCDEKYYIIVIEDPEQHRKDMEAQAAKNKDAGVEETGTRQEGCSCLFGNPCVDQYICKDWNNRMEVAKKNGWKGF